MYVYTSTAIHTKLEPSLANSRAHASPIPEEAPVLCDVNVSIIGRRTQLYDGCCLHEDIFVDKATGAIETCSEGLVECFTAITEHAEKSVWEKEGNWRCPTTSTHGIRFELCYTTNSV